MQQLLPSSPRLGRVGAAATATFTTVTLASALLAPAAIAQTVSGAPFFSLVSPDPALVVDDAVVAVGDVNGDGFDDLGLSATLAGTPIAAVLPGGPDGVGAAPLWVLVGVESNHVLAGVGDLDGDGFDELALGEPEWDGPGDPNTGRVRLFFGAANGPSSAAGWSWVSGYSNNATGAAIANVGDFDGDGDDELAIGAPDWNAPATHSGAVHVFEGTPSGPKSSATWTFTGFAANEFHGAAVCGADVNADGYSDVIAGVPGANRVEIYFGAQFGQSFFGQTLTGPASSNAFGAVLALAGDVDRDGVADLLVGDPDGASGAGSAFCYLGAPGSMDTQSVWREDGAASGAAFATSLVGVGDMDGDGYDDVLVGAPFADAGAGSTTDRGRVRLFKGSPAGPTGGASDDALPLWDALGAPGERFGSGLAALDLDGDGVPEIATTSPGAGAGGGVAVRRHVRRTAPFAWPGSGLDLRLVTSVGPDTEPTALDSKPVLPGDTVRVRVESPAGGLVGLPLLVGLEVHASGAWNGPVPGVFTPELQLDVLGTLTLPFTAPALLPGGNTFAFSVPSGFDALGETWRLQGFALTAAAPNGAFVATDAHELRVGEDLEVFVDGANGNDANDGRTTAAPVRTLGRALDIARSGAGGQVAKILVTAGTYTEPDLTIDVSVRLFGGYDGATWQPQPGTRSIVETDHLGATIEGLTGAAVVRAVEFRSADATSSAPGEESSVAVRVVDCAEVVVFEDCRFLPGRGANGLNGSQLAPAPEDGVDGSDGTNALNFVSTFTPDGGAGGGGGGFAGGAGGDGEIALNGYDGEAGGGPCGAPAGAGGDMLPFIAGEDGFPGADAPAAANGNNGVPALEALAVFGGVPFTTISGAGEDGDRGCGGGGGGGGAGYFATTGGIIPIAAAGAGGGGGGGGGAGGAGGGGARAGGSSIAVLLYASEARFTDCRFQTSNGGNGGAGADGQDGGFGGVGGNPGAGAGFSVDLGGIGIGVEVGAGGPGGAGANGGGGGGGAGGHGGLSVGIYEAFGGSADLVVGNDFVLGPGGTGGPGGSQGTTGLQAPAGPTGSSVAIAGD